MPDEHDCGPGALIRGMNRVRRGPAPPGGGAFLRSKGWSRVRDLADSAKHPQTTFFRATDHVPEETWYWFALISIGISATLKLMQKDHWALFVGQWPPTFLLFGLYHRLVKPGETA